MRPSHDLGAGRKALTLPGNVGLEWGAYRAGFVEQARVRQRLIGAGLGLGEQIEDYGYLCVHFQP